MIINVIVGAKQLSSFCQLSPPPRPEALGPLHLWRGIGPTQVPDLDGGRGGILAVLGPPTSVRLLRTVPPPHQPSRKPIDIIFRRQLGAVAHRADTRFYVT